MHVRRFGVFSAMVVLTSTYPLSAQSFNVAFGPENLQPPQTYGGAGLPGYWNATPGAHGTSTFNLKDVNGTTTVVRLHQIGGLQLLNVNDPGTTAADQTLMDTFLVTYSAFLETCVYFYDLQNGIYELTVYAWMPRSPTTMSYVSCDQEPGFPHLVVGGGWPGGHVEGVTFSRHYGVVGPPLNGRLVIHSGIVPGANPAHGAAMNGIQIRRLPSIVQADMNCDGQRDGEDLRLFVQALTDHNAYHAEQPLCNVLNGDMNGNWEIDAADVAPFVQALLAG